MATTHATALIEIFSFQDGWALLHTCARYGHLHIVRELVEKMNADVLAEDAV